MGNQSSVEEITEQFDNLNIVNRLTKPNSDWGHYQHSPKEPFVGKPGLVVDLETFWANGWSKTYIQQIGACSIGIVKPDFEVLCDLPDRPFTTVEGMYKWFHENGLDGAKSASCWKKVLNVRTDESVLNCLNSSSKWWKDKKVRDFSFKNMKRLQASYSSRYPLVFPLKYGLFFFLEYTKNTLVWYAHNGNRFDFPILEKNFERYNIPYSCVPKGNAPGKQTSAMGAAFRIKYNMPLKKYRIECYDTMLMMRQHPESKYNKRGYGAKRVSQGVQVGQKDGKIVWSTGERTKDLYSYKLQDIINDVGMKANHVTAHTALADCLTLRECLYRVFSDKDASEMKEKAKQERKESLKHKITERLK